MSKRDYYDILDVSRDTSKEEIKSKYRKLALTHHPDRNKSPGAEEKFKEITEAYAVLSDDQKRSQYDQFGHEGIGNRYSSDDLYRNVDFNDIFQNLGSGFDSIFSKFFGGRQSYSEEVGQDLSTSITLTLEQAASGVSTEIKIPRTEICNECKGSGSQPGSKAKTCNTCQGRGEVHLSRSMGFTRIITTQTCHTCQGKGVYIEKPCKKCKSSGVMRNVKKINLSIPSGVDDGFTLRLKGEGDIAQRSKRYGDLYVTLRIKPHKQFIRDGDNIHFNTNISFTQAALGSEIAIPTLDGAAWLKIPSGTQNRTVLRLKGKGMPRIQSKHKGDELVTVNVIVPKKLNEKQKRLLQELAKDFD